ncbi:unnamed protein product [Prunus armeniaca]
MKPAARSLSISALMIATRSGAKLRLFCTTGLLAGLTWSRWQMMFGSIPGMSDGDHANMSLLFWRKMASNLLQGSLPGGFPNLDPSCLDSGASRSTLPCLADQDQVVLTQRLPQASNLFQGSLPGGFPRLDPSCLDSGPSGRIPSSRSFLFGFWRELICASLSGRPRSGATPFPFEFTSVNCNYLLFLSPWAVHLLAIAWSLLICPIPPQGWGSGSSNVKPDQVLILEADDGRIQNGWYFRCDLGDISYLSDLSLALLGGQLDSWESTRMVLTRMTFWGGSLAAASRSSICWMAFFATNSVQWPSLTSSSRCLF